MAYATVADVQARMKRTMTQEEQALCGTLLDDAAVMIDATGTSAGNAAKLTVSCRMVVRAMGDGSDGVPMGATQGSMSALGYFSFSMDSKRFTALGYSQSWTISSGGSVGELYLSKADKAMLGVSNAIGSYSPVQEFTGVIG